MVRLGSVALGALWLVSCGNGGGSLTAPEPGGHHVLFIGNSLTYVNDLPGTLAALAASAGDTIRVRQVAKPDAALVDYLYPGSDALNAVALGGWEYVVLQQGPSSVAVNRDTLILATRAFDEKIRAVGARTALYMVWPSSDRVSFFDAVRESYQAAAQSVGGAFFPGGAAWLEAWKTHPEFEFYGSDGFHPTELATYLVALVMYERITGHDARQLSATATVAGHRLDASAATVRALQAAAHATNLQYP